MVESLPRKGLSLEPIVHGGWWALLKAMSTTYTPTHLVRWTRPRHYVGANWPGWYCAPVQRNRDSSILENCNWDLQLATLKAHSIEVADEEITSPTVVSENHCMCGWVEWLAIHESNTEALKAADAIAERLESYPTLSDDRLSEAEHDAYQDEWKNRYTKREFARGLKRIFGLRDETADRIEEADSDILIEAFESQVPSGEFFTPEGDGVKVRIDSALRSIDRMPDQEARDWMATLLRNIKNHKP